MGFNPYRAQRRRTSDYVMVAAALVVVAVILLWALIPRLTDGVEVRRVHPFQAWKTYVCPGCQQEVRPGTGHLVVVPLGAPDLRRHWHRPCWERRARRRPGRP